MTRQPPPLDSRKAPANARPARLSLRIFIALLVGATVFCLALFTAWRNGGPGLLNNHMVRVMTWADIQTLKEAVSNHLARTGTLPESLDKLDLEAHWFRFAAQRYRGLQRRRGQLLDGWGRPYLYSTDGTNYMIISYARDGKIGGPGFLDFDVSNLDPDPFPEFSGSDRYLRPSLRQFLFELSSEGMILACLLCGVTAFMLCMTTIKPDEFDRKEPGAAIARIAAIVLVTVIVSFFLVIGHVPSGH